MKNIRTVLPIMAICVVLFLLNLASNNDVFSSKNLGFYNIHSENFQWYQLFTAPFVHANIVHLAMNLLAIQQIAKYYLMSESNFNNISAKLVNSDNSAEAGETVKEQNLHSGYTLKLSMILFFGAILSFVPLFILGNESIPTVGISGGIMAIYGYILLHWKHSTHQLSVFINVFITFLFGFLPFVSQTAHVSGVIIGMTIAVIHNIINAHTLKKEFSNIYSKETLQNFNESGFSEKSYIAKNTYLYVLTGLNFYHKKSTKMADLVDILNSPTKGYGKEYYQEQTDYLERTHSTIFERAKSIRQEHEKKTGRESLPMFI